MITSSRSLDGGGDRCLPKAVTWYFYVPDLFDESVCSESFEQT
jgi:hypothetical protein